MVDARWGQRRVYGADHDDPDSGPREGHEYVELSGGPLDGLLLDVTGIPAADCGGRRCVSSLRCLTEPSSWFLSAVSR
jgi:hypothetical protein